MSLPDSGPRPACDCWKHANQVCDICQGVDGTEVDAAPARDSEPVPAQAVLGRCRDCGHLVAVAAIANDRQQMEDTQEFVDHGYHVTIGNLSEWNDHMEDRCKCALRSSSASSTTSGTPLLRPEILAAIALVNADCRRLAFGKGPHAQPSIYEILASTPEQGTDVAEAIGVAMFGDGYMLSHQRRLLAIALSRALTELAALRSGSSSGETAAPDREFMFSAFNMGYHAALEDEYGFSPLKRLRADKALEAFARHEANGSFAVYSTPAQQFTGKGWQTVEEYIATLRRIAKCPDGLPLERHIALLAGSATTTPESDGEDSLITTDVRECGGLLLHVTDADNICAERGGLYGLGDTVEEALANLHERPHASAPPSTPAGEFCSKCGHALSLHRVSTLGAMTVACATCSCTLAPSTPAPPATCFHTKPAVCRDCGMEVVTWPPSSAPRTPSATGIRREVYAECREIIRGIKLLGVGDGNEFDDGYEAACGHISSAIGGRINDLPVEDSTDPAQLSALSSPTSKEGA